MKNHIEFKTNYIYYMSIQNNFDQDLFYRLLAYCDNDKQNRINSMRFNIDKKLSLYSDILIRKLLSNALNIKNKELQFYKNKYGKPYVKNIASINYNVSHTHNALVVIFSESEVGVDIEGIKEVDIKIAKKYYTEEEYNYVILKNSNIHFYEIWTKKEAFVKYVGNGLNISFKSFNTLSDDINCNMTTFLLDKYLISVYGKKKFDRKNLINLKEEFMNEIYF